MTVFPYGRSMAAGFGGALSYGDAVKKIDLREKENIIMRKYLRTFRGGSGWRSIIFI